MKIGKSLLLIIPFLLLLSFSGARISLAASQPDIAKLIDQDNTKNVDYFRKDSVKILAEDTTTITVSSGTYHVLMVSAAYQTERDTIFHFNQQGFFYYDLDNKQFIPNATAEEAKDVQNFEKARSADENVGSNVMNEIYMAIFLFLLVVTPNIFGGMKTPYART